MVLSATWIQSLSSSICLKEKDYFMLTSRILETHPQSKSQTTKLYQKAFTNLLIIHVKYLKMKGAENKDGVPGATRT